MKIEITILSAPIKGFVIPPSPMQAEIGGIGTLIVNNYYTDGGAGGYILTEADKEAIAALARYDDTSVRNLIGEGDAFLGDYIDAEIQEVYDAMSLVDQRSLLNFYAIATLQENFGTVASVLDALNGEVI